VLDLDHGGAAVVDGKAELASTRPHDDHIGAIEGIWVIRTPSLDVVSERTTAVAIAHGAIVRPGSALGSGARV
jgi:hypothetical protein